MRAIASIPSPSIAPRRPELGRHPDGDRAGSEPRREPGRSLVVLDRDACDAQRPGHCLRPTAAFLAHLIATAQKAPQTRQRRRAEPQDAAALYAACAALADRR
jgi:hypothetical protein